MFVASTGEKNAKLYLIFEFVMVLGKD
jgi:hypothetical protein